VSDLFSSLQSATRALQAQSFGLDVTGQNIANVNTPGYTRRVVDLAAVPPESRWSAGRGVEIEGIRSQRDRLIERRLEQELSGAARESALADALSGVEGALGPGGEAIDQRLAAFFDSFARLADSPTSAVARQDVLLQGTAVAEAFHDTADRLSHYRRDADRQLLGTIDQINSLSTQIAKINQSLASTSDQGTRLHLQDQQGALVRQLAELTHQCSLLVLQVEARALVARRSQRLIDLRDLGAQQIGRAHV